MGRNFNNDHAACHRCGALHGALGVADWVCGGVRWRGVVGWDAISTVTMQHATVVARYTGLLSCWLWVDVWGWGVAAAIFD